MVLVLVWASSILVARWVRAGREVYIHLSREQAVFVKLYESTRPPVCVHRRRFSHGTGDATCLGLCLCLSLPGQHPADARLCLLQEARERCGVPRRHAARLILILAMMWATFTVSASARVGCPVSMVAPGVLCRRLSRSHLPTSNLPNGPLVVYTSHVLSRFRSNRIKAKEGQEKSTGVLDGGGRGERCLRCKDGECLGRGRTTE
jgi:hypothetical protein